MFKLDLVDHHIWVPVQLLEPCLNLSGGCEDQRASWSGKGSGGVIGQTDPSSEVVYDDSAETHRPIQAWTCCTIFCTFNQRKFSAKNLETSVRGSGHIYRLPRLPRSLLPRQDFLPVWPGYSGPSANQFQ